MFYDPCTNFLSTKRAFNLVPGNLKKSVIVMAVSFYSTYNNFTQPTLFKFGVGDKLFKQKKRKLLKIKSERGVFAPHHKLRQNLDGLTSEEKEYLSDDRSCFLVPNTIHNLCMHTGQEYRPIPPGTFKVIGLNQRGYDYYKTQARGEDMFFYEDPIFQFKKNKLGEYIFTKRTGPMIHVIKKKK